MKKSKLNKIYIVAVIVTAVVFAACCVVYLVTKKGNPEQPSQAQTTQISEMFDPVNSEFSAKCVLQKDDNEIILPSGEEGLFYSCSLDNEVKFYTFTGERYESFDGDVKEVTVSFTASFDSLRCAVKYVDFNGRTVGFGVATADSGLKSDKYEFAFLKLINKPASYGNGYLLLADFNKNEFYSGEKIYSEIYDFNLSSGNTSTYVSNNTRLIDLNGTLRQDWTMLTDEFIRNMGEGKYFLSSRYYSYDETGYRSDVMVLSNAYRPAVVVSDIMGTWFVNNEDGMHYIKKTDTGFDVCVKKGDDVSVLRSFSGDYNTDYLHSGNKILDKISLTVTDLLTGETKQIKDVLITGEASFAVSPDGTKAVIYQNKTAGGKSDENQSIAFINFNSNSTENFTEPLLFNENCPVFFADNGTLSFARVSSSDGSKAGTYTYSF
ncbi:MAG: hypothetical protein K6B52_04050 [Clostridiales bacterium]|nr:hypothetical protein [Clostridiales bacterium]